MLFRTKKVRPKRIYNLYTEGPDQQITNKYGRHGPTERWHARVRAVSIKQAYSLLGCQQVASGRSDVGVVRLENTRFPGEVDEWPWDMPVEKVGLS